jgi:hypothetical protein
MLRGEIRDETCLIEPRRLASRVIRHVSWRDSRIPPGDFSNLRLTSFIRTTRVSFGSYGRWMFLQHKHPIC